MAGFNGGFLILDDYDYTTSSGNNNDVELYGSRVGIDTQNNFDAITGFLNQDGAIVQLININTTNNLLLKYNDSNSDVANRLLTPSLNDLVLPPLYRTFMTCDENGWHVMPVSFVSENTLQDSPSNPSGTTSSTGVMMGLTESITPMKSGKLMIIISGNIANNGSGDGAKAQIRYGTGTAPTNGAALTGTASGNTSQIVNAALSLLVPGSGNFNCNTIVSGLTLGTPHWLDLSLARVTGGTATVSGISISVIEL